MSGLDEVDFLTSTGMLEFEELPEHLRAQGQQAFDVAKRHGDAKAGDGAFPL